MAVVAVNRRRGRPQAPEFIVPPADLLDHVVLMTLQVNAKYIHLNITVDYETTRNWLVRHRLLANSATCRRCHHAMRLTKCEELQFDKEQVS